jgi:hypothetical protein
VENVATLLHIFDRTRKELDEIVGDPPEAWRWLPRQ